jgi:uncharacterized protein
MNEPWYSIRLYLRERFGSRRVIKVPIDAGFSCPNKDGRVGRRGCIFCDAYGAGPLDAGRLSVNEQIDRVANAHPGTPLIAYFQAHANTAAPLEQLTALYEQVLRRSDVVGLALATRPDAISGAVLGYLADVHQRTWLTVELGLQSRHEKSLLFLERNHTYNQFLETFQALRERGIEVVVHLIVGIPGEGPAEWLETVEEMNGIRPAGIKFHLLHVLRNTRLYQMHLSKQLRLLEQDEYVEGIIGLLEHLRPDIVVHRLTADREPELFAAPEWARSKARVIQQIRDRMVIRSAFQGRLWSVPPICF